MTKTFAVLLLLVVLRLGNLSALQLPAIEDETEVDGDLDVEQVLSIILTKLSVDSLPLDAREDGRDIVNNLRDELMNCKQQHHENLSSLRDFKACVHEKTEDAKTEVWNFVRDLRNEPLEYFDDYTSSSSLLSLRLFLIPLMAAGLLANML